MTPSTAWPPHPPPAPSAVRRRIVERRRRPRGLPAGVYEWCLYLAVTVGLVAGAMTRFAGSLAVQPWVVALVAAGAAAVMVRALLRVGPIVAGPARRMWVLSTPVDRRGILAPGLAGLLGGAGAGAGASTTLVGVLSGVPGPDLVALAGIAVGVGTALAAATVVVQSTDVRIPRIVRACDVTAVACIGGVVAGAAGGHLLGGPPDRPAPTIVVIAVVVAVVASAAAWARLDRIRTRRLAAGHAIVGTAMVSARYLDASVLTSLTREQATRARGTVRPARIGGRRPVALLLADLARIRRSPTDLVVFVVLLPGPFLASALGAPELVGAVQMVCATLAADRLARGLRLVSRSSALRRLVGGADGALRRIHLVWPALGVALHVGLSSWAAPPGLVAALLSLAGSVAVVYRSATRPPLDYAGGAFDVGLLGPFPVGLALQLLRGPVLLAVLVTIQVTLATA